MKKVLFVISFVLSSCNKGEKHNCVCYNNLGTDSVTYNTYVTNNTKSEAEKYCSKISTTKIPCWISE